MKYEIENIDKNIYDICVLINNLVNLNVEFIDKTHASIIQLISSNISPIIQPSRNKTIMFIDSFLRDTTPNDFFYYTDNFQLSYLGVGLWEGIIYNGSIIVGPFLSDDPDEVFISNIIEINKIPLFHKQLVSQYYSTLTTLSLHSYKSIGNIMVTLTKSSIISANMLIYNNNFIPSTKEENIIDSNEFNSIIEFRYKTQKKLMNAVKNGLKEEALNIFSLFNFNSSHRVPNNPLRAKKNLFFSVSAMLRIAAEGGGVPPILLHNTSDMYASLIEKASSMSQLESTVTQMVAYYCDLVKNYSTSGYSPNISKAINYINLNFNNPISLTKIANSINLNPSHLSRQFKKEVNITITDFINKKRVEAAKFLLEQNEHSITEISMLVGFESHNYFYSVFKEITGLTPKKYLDSLKELK